MKIALFVFALVILASSTNAFALGSIPNPEARRACLLIEDKPTCEADARCKWKTDLVTPSRSRCMAK